ncbi:hypothetical protein LMG27952_06780 [Paraburkholderia hiiakae]|uniref:DUF4148 domain-containing protein n=1 Tax=Paraburkholderia hiiakae TaxID=1081782 RepID=A0ABM8P8I0_9BURK|nr:DUF4148 domain-containing protein [Paraburkholderia hiiakae]CAD6559056.1 hypothetical protein LMG27952_06780 [Paraburkholderia hiiakae]
MSKTLLCILVSACAVTVPASGFAQSTQPLTRAEVRADLVRVEQAGYSPGRGEDINYPADIQAAEARISMDDTKNAARQDVGGVPLEGRSSAGARVHMPAQADCVGPVSFCNLYFGS